MRIVPKDNPKWFELRRKAAHKLVKLARIIYPKSPEVMAFHLECMQDYVITGKCITRIDPDMLKPTKEQ